MKIRFGVIYKIINLRNNMVYVGQTTKRNTWDRVKVHYKNNKSYIGRAIAKYGKENFKWEEVACSSNLADLNFLERYFIDKFDCLVPNGYNLDLGGNSAGKSHPLTKLKLSLRKKHNHKKTGKKRSRKRTEEEKKALSEMRKGFYSKNRKRAREIITYKRRKGYYENSSFNTIKIITINIKTNDRCEFDSIADCCAKLNLDATCVSRVCRGKDGRTQHKGYKFFTEKYGESLATLPPYKNIYKINNGGYSVKIKNKYIGYRKTYEEAVILRDEHLSKVD